MDEPYKNFPEPEIIETKEIIKRLKSFSTQDLNSLITVFNSIMHYVRIDGIEVIEQFCGYTNDELFELGLKSIRQGTDPFELEVIYNNIISNLVDDYKKRLSIIQLGLISLQSGDNPRLSNAKLKSAIGKCV